jgi:hypothetical protein
MAPERNAPLAQRGPELSYLKYVRIVRTTESAYERSDSIRLSVLDPMTIRYRLSQPPSLNPDSLVGHSNGAPARRTV